jgi:hypothetical protein
MCGLVGCTGKLGKIELSAFAYLGVLSSLRGEHSTGYMDYSPKMQQDYDWFKTTASADEIFAVGGTYYQKYYYKRYKTEEPKAIAVHARAATIGEVNRKNAHPFQHKHIIGMHNGTVRNKFDNSDKFQTDSEAIIYNIAHQGDEFLKELQDIGGAYALVWMNTKENTLNFFRNKERPLWFWTAYDNSSTFWASDENWLRSVLPYYNIRGKLEELPEHFRVTMKLDKYNPVMEVSKKELRKFQRFTPALKDNSFGIGTSYWREKTTWNKVAAAYQTQEEADRYWSELEKRVDEAKDRKAAEEVKKEAEKADTKVLPFTPTPTSTTNRSTGEKPSGETDIEVAIERMADDNKIIVGKDNTFYFETFTNVYVNEKYYRKLIAEGCSACNTAINIYDDLLFLSKTDFLCESCRMDSYVRVMIEQEVADEEALIRSGARQPKIIPNYELGEEEIGGDEDEPFEPDELPDDFSKEVIVH